MTYRYGILVICEDTRQHPNHNDDDHPPHSGHVLPETPTPATGLISAVRMQIILGKINDIC